MLSYKEPVIPAHIRLQNNIRSALLSSAYEKQQQEIRQQNLQQHHLLQIFNDRKIESEFMSTIFYGPLYIRLFIIDVIVLICFILVGIAEYVSHTGETWQLQMYITFRCLAIIPVLIAITTLLIPILRHQYPLIIESVHTCVFIAVHTLQLLSEMVNYKTFPIYTTSPPLFFPEGVILLSCVFNIFSRYVHFILVTWCTLIRIFLLVKIGFLKSDFVSPLCSSTLSFNPF